MWKLLLSVLKSVRKAIVHDPEVKRYVQTHPRFTAFLTKRFSPDEKTGLYLTLGLGVAAVFFFYFLGIVEDLMMKESIVAVDYRIITLVQMFRTGSFTDGMLLMTYLGTWQVVLAGVFLSALLLLVARRWYEFAVLMVSVGSGGVFVLMVKLIGQRERPELVNALASEQTFSFPSGHGFIAIVFYGLWAYFLFRVAKNRGVRFGIIVITLCLVISIGFSRIYLGVHWPSDVLAGYTVGAAWLVMTVTPLEIRRRFDAATSTAKTPLRIGVLFFLAWTLFVVCFFTANPLRPSHPAVTETETVSPGDIGANLFATLPNRSEDIIGEPLLPFNLIVVATREKLDQTLQNAGWRLPGPVTLAHFGKLAIRVLLDKPYPDAPVSPSFWDRKPNDMLYEKPTPKNSARERALCYIWKTPFVLEDGRRVWLVTVHVEKSLELLPLYTIDPLVDREREVVLKELQQSGDVESVRSFNISDQILGRNMAGDNFFTDGGSYIVSLESERKNHL